MATDIFTKDPDALLDYEIDWATWLNGDQITVSSWAVPAGITSPTDTNTTTTTTIWLSGGTAGQWYDCVNHITTAAGREDDRTLAIYIRESTGEALEAAALLELTRLAYADSCPALSLDEQRDILARYRRATVWATGTAYAIGARIVPTAANRNGHHFIAVRYTATATDQMSGATEPTWTATTAAEYTDNHIVWREAGWDWDGALWDLSGAVRQAWLTKAAKASVTSDTRVGDLSIRSSQLFDHCMAMAKQYQKSYAV